MYQMVHSPENFWVPNYPICHHIKTVISIQSPVVSSAPGARAKINTYHFIKIDSKIWVRKVKSAIRLESLSEANKRASVEYLS